MKNKKKNKYKRKKNKRQKVESLSLPKQMAFESDGADFKANQMGMKFELAQFVLKFLGAVVLIILGFVIVNDRVTDEDLRLEIAGIELTTQYVGVIVLILGLVALIKTSFTVKIKNQK